MLPNLANLSQWSTAVGVPWDSLTVDMQRVILQKLYMEDIQEEARAIVRLCSVNTEFAVLCTEDALFTFLLAMHGMRRHADLYGFGSSKAYYEMLTNLTSTQIKALKLIAKAALIAWNHPSTDIAAESRELLHAMATLMRTHHLPNDLFDHQNDYSVNQMMMNNMFEHLLAKHRMSEHAVLYGLTDMRYYKMLGGLTPQQINLLVALANGQTHIDASGFSDCVTLSIKQLPPTVTTIGNRAFFHCKSLALDRLPPTMTIIQARAFTGCTSLVLELLPQTVTTIQTLAFAGCKSLVLKSLPPNLAYIGKNAFWRCTSVSEEIRNQLLEIQMNTVEVTDSESESESDST
jgi:hypothetical protein